MAYYYVKTDGANDGTKVTGSLTKQTGSFATLGVSSYYATIELAITGGATSGDFICVSDLHAFSTVSTLSHAGPTAGDFLYIVTVDDANCDAQAAVPASPQEQTTVGGDIVCSGRVSYYGASIKSADNLTFSGATTFYGGVVEGTDLVGIGTDGASVTLNNTEWNYFDLGIDMRISAGSTFTALGGSTNAVSFLTKAQFIGGGGNVALYGFDLSTITGTIFKGIGSAPVDDDAINLIVQGCKINAAAVWLNETLEDTNHRLTATNSAATSAAAEHQYYVETYGGNVEDQDDAGIHRDESTAYPSGTKVSLKCSALATATPAAPFWFDMPVQYTELSNTASDTIRIYLTSTTALYDSSVWAEAVYPDDTTKHLYNYLSTRHDNILDTNGTALSTDAGSTWKDGASDLAVGTEYYIDIDMSATANNGADCIPIVRIYVATAAAATIYFDTTVDLV